MDAVITKAPFGGKSTGPNPYHRQTEVNQVQSVVYWWQMVNEFLLVYTQMVLTDRHDMKMSKATLQSIVVIYRPEPTIRSKQHMCLDKGYDFPEVYELLEEEYGYTIHIRLRGEEISNNKEEGIPKYRARRWVVERTYSWMNRFRRLLIRWEKKVENHIAMLHFACAWITYRRVGIFGYVLSQITTVYPYLYLVCMY